MKPIIPHDRQVIVSGTDHETVDMTLDPTSLVHLMNTWIDMYKDAEMAVLREYSTNAWDSHVEARYGGPVEVRLPNDWEPVLKIIDHGIGLSKQDLKEIYAKYGASTKRESNEVVGMLGLGCKSALTYTEQFTIIAVKDHMRTVVSVSRNALGAGSLRFMEHVATTEPNGVTITIPARKENSFAKKAAFLFQFWPAGSVTVDGKEPERIKSADHVVNNIHVIPGNQSYIVMGNVPYPVDPEDLGLDFEIRDNNIRYRQVRYRQGRYEHSVLAYLPIGTVEPAPNRESLRDTEETQAALAAVGRQFAETIGKRTADAVNAAPTRRDAVIAKGQWQQKLPNVLQPQQWTYRGEVIPNNFKGETDRVDTGDRYNGNPERGFVVLRKTHSEGNSLYSRHGSINAYTGARSVWLYGFDVRFTSKHRRKLDHWFKDKGIEGHTQFILVNGHPRDKDYYPWINQSWVFDWQEVRDTRVPSEARGSSGRLAGSYDHIRVHPKKGPIRVQDRRSHHHPPAEILATDIEPTKPLFYFVSDHSRTTRSRYETTREQAAFRDATLLCELVGDCYILLIPPSRENKLVRDFPRAKTLQQGIKDRYNRWRAQLSPEQLMALAMHSLDQHDSLVTLDPDRLDDPKLRQAVRIANLDIKNALARWKLFTNNGVAVELPKWANPLKHYPLRLPVQPSDKALDHYYLYLNQAYHAFYRNASAALAA